MSNKPTPKTGSAVGPMDPVGLCASQGQSLDGSGCLGELGRQMTWQWRKEALSVKGTSPFNQY